jgi:hypothetical protein
VVRKKYQLKRVHTRLRPVLSLRETAVLAVFQKPRFFDFFLSLKTAVSCIFITDYLPPVDRYSFFMLVVESERRMMKSLPSIDAPKQGVAFYSLFPRKLGHVAMLLPHDRFGAKDLDRFVLY